MGSFSSKTRSRGRGIFCQEGSDPDHEIVRFSDEHYKNPPSQLSNNEANNENKNQKTQVFVEGYYIEAAADGEDNNLMRTKSLTEVDLDELKGCLDLGFGFSYDEIPELCNTLPALELCYSMNHRFLDDHQKLPGSPVAAGMVANWRISSPGEVSGQMPGFNASLLPCCSSISACNKKNVVATNMRVLYQHALIDSGSSHSFRSSTLPRRVPTNFEPFGRRAISIATRDPPEDVKARLKYWAQAVACTVRLCS